jgi:hypothetical protein
VSCAKNAGEGWRAWHKIGFEEWKLAHHHGTVKFLQHVIGEVLGAGNSVGSSMLVLFEFFCEACRVSEVEKEQKAAVKVLLPKYSKIFEIMSKGLADAALLQQQLQQITGVCSCKQEAVWCMEEAVMNNEQASMILHSQGGPPSRVPKDAKAAFWERNKPLATPVSAGPAGFAHAFPRFLCFLNSLYCTDRVDSGIQEASRACLCSVFRVLCATPFAMEDDEYVRREGLNSILFRSNTATPCAGFAPLSQGDVCMCCQQPQGCHVLKYNGRGDSSTEIQFMRVACRVGSMGWDSHPLMQLVHGSKHLGGSFDERSVAASQSSYRQHLQHHVFAADPSRSDAAACDMCARKSLEVESLPQVVRDEVDRLQQQRRAECHAVIDAIDRCFAPRSPRANAGGAQAAAGSSLAAAAACDFGAITSASAPTTLVSPVVTPDPCATAGWQSARGGSVQLLGARPLDELRSMSAEALGSEIASISPDYVAYRALFVSAGFDGMLLCDAADDADLKQLVQDLGIASDIHRRRVLVQLRNVLAKHKQSPHS